MRLGLLADVHEALELLREAIELFRRRGVDEIVCLGDICAMHDDLEETVEVLREAGVVGVWGNHDFGLCKPIDDSVRARYGKMLEYTTTLQPRLVRDDCLFTHVE